jgi:hypothetical protein
MRERPQRARDGRVGPPVRAKRRRIADVIVGPITYSGRGGWAKKKRIEGSTSEPPRRGAPRHGEKGEVTCRPLDVHERSCLMIDA